MDKVLFVSSGEEYDDLIKHFHRVNSDGSIKINIGPI
jgi:hypothetical protein